MNRKARLIIEGNDNDGKITYIVRKLLDRISEIKRIETFDFEKMCFFDKTPKDQIIAEFVEFIAKNKLYELCIVLKNYQYVFPEIQTFIRDCLDNYEKFSFIIITDSTENVIDPVLNRMFGLKFKNTDTFDDNFYKIGFGIEPKKTLTKLHETTTSPRVIIIKPFVDEDKQEITNNFDNLRKSIIHKYYDQKNYNTFYCDVFHDTDFEVNSIRYFLNQETDNNGREKCLIMDNVSFSKSKFKQGIIAKLIEEYPEVTFITFTEFEFDFNFMPCNHNFSLYDMSKEIENPLNVEVPLYNLLKLQ